MLIFLWLLSLSMLVNAPMGTSRMLTFQGVALLAWWLWGAGVSVTPGPPTLALFCLVAVTLMAAVELVAFVALAAVAVHLTRQAALEVAAKKLSAAVTAIDTTRPAANGPVEATDPRLTPKELKPEPVKEPPDDD